MNDYVIEAEQLMKRYGKHAALNGVPCPEPSSARTEPEKPRPPAF